MHTFRGRPSHRGSRGPLQLVASAHSATAGCGGWCRPRPIGTTRFGLVTWGVRPQCPRSILVATSSFTGLPLMRRMELGMKALIRTNRWAVVGAVTGVVLAGGALALGASSPSSGDITVCVPHGQNAVVHIASTNGACPRGYT